MPLLKLLRANQNLIFYVAVLLMVMSLPLSRFGLSLAQFSLLGIWLLGDGLKERIRRFFNNKAAMVLVSFYLLHVIGLIYTSDFTYATKDLRVKLPLLFLPIVFSTFEVLGKKKTDRILLIYIASVLVASLISLGILLFGHTTDFRDLSPFISHIRLSLNVCIAIFFAVYYAFYSPGQPTLLKRVLLITTIWLVFFLLLIESITGFVILVIIILMLIAYSFFISHRLKQRLILIGILIIIPLALTLYLQKTVNDYLIPPKITQGQLEQLTADGNTYSHDTVYQPVENGSYIGLYVCESELRDSWNKRSGFDFDGPDKRGQKIKNTLIRYLNSMHLKKDASGVNQLSSTDIQHIEQGIANVYYAKKFCFNARIYRLLWEYQVKQHHGNPGGHTLIQRFEYWRTSIEIIRHNFIIGVGVGDIDQAFKNAYENMRSPLGMEWRHRAHNQFLAIIVSFGILGLLWFLIALIYPAVHLKKFLSFRYFVFFVTLFISMLVEDTLETQMGVTLFAFFNAFLLFGVKEDEF